MRLRANWKVWASRLERRRIFGIVAVLAVVWIAFWWILVPFPFGLGSGDPGESSLMEQRVREARERGESLVIRRAWTPLERISGNLQRAVIVAEDYRFREHRGVDWVSLAEEVHWTGDSSFSWLSPRDLRALVRALGYVVAHRDEVRGRSTITQQLAKNLYWGTDRSFVRKAMEFVVARRLERRLGKDRILELYLNVAEWGPGIFGAEAAARTYFGRSAADLTLIQAAALAATLPHPLTSNPSRSPGRMEWRRDLILGRLRPGVPPAPMPLPEPDPQFTPLDGTAPSTPSENLGPDGLPPDALPTDTLFPDGSTDDTIPPEAGRPDTLPFDPVEPDTLGSLRETIGAATDRR
jgi:monofunctional biosynthetic peptidoglycan transglycosylase